MTNFYDGECFTVDQVIGRIGAYFQDIPDFLDCKRGLLRRFRGRQFLYVVTHNLPPQRPACQSLFDFQGTLLARITILQ
jgi:hypothetical protein